MICIFGDTHGIHHLDKVFSYYDRFEEYILAEDYFVLLGDFSLPYYYWNDLQKIRERYALDNLAKLKCKVLVVDGNHEYFEYLDKCEEVDMFGDKVGKIWENVYHLKRGRVYNIDNKKVFTFGGARSIDKEDQLLQGTWSDRELPSQEEKDLAILNLQKVNYNVDYIFTHTAPNLLFKHVVVPIKLYTDFNDPTTDFLDVIFNKVTFKQWCIGHYHIDFSFEKYNFLFNEVRVL